MYQKTILSEAPIQANIQVPGCKDISQRALFLASLSEGVSEIKNIFLDQNTHDLINALKLSGIVIQVDVASQSCVVAGCGGKLPVRQATLWCETIEPSAYYLLGISSLAANVYFFDCPPAYRSLLSSSLINTLIDQGAQTIPQNADHMPCTFIGTNGLRGGEVIFDNPVHQQVMSTLLMIAPYANNNFHFTFNMGKQTTAIDLTCAMMADFGVLVHRIHQNQFMVPVPQHYHARSYVVEPDMIIAAYFFGAAAVTAGKIAIQAFKPSTSKQAHVKILSALEKMGCELEESVQNYTLTAPKQLLGIEINLRIFSDVFLVLAALAPFAKSPTRLNHIGAMSDDEANLLKHFSEALTALNVQVEIGTDWLQISPSVPKSARLDTHGDFRLAMAYAILGLRVADIVIENSDCVNKIFPNFFAEWEKLVTSFSEVI